MEHLRQAAFAIAGALALGLAGVTLFGLPAARADDAVWAGDEQPLRLDVGGRHGEPVSETTSTHDLVRETRTVYEDGTITQSFIQVEEGVVDLEKLGIEAPKTGAVEPQSISACTVTTGSGFRSFKNCKIAGTIAPFATAKVNMWFGASYTLVEGTKNDYISSTFLQGSSCVFPASCASLPERSVWQPREPLTGGWALATYAMPFSVGGFGSGTAYLELRVGNNTAGSTAAEGG